MAVVTLWIKRGGASLLRPEEICGCQGEWVQASPHRGAGGRDGNKAESHMGGERDECESWASRGAPSGRHDWSVSFAVNWALLGTCQGLHEHAPASSYTPTFGECPEGAAK